MSTHTVVWTREHVIALFAAVFHKCEHGKAFDEYCYHCAAEGQRKQKEGR